MSRAFTCQSVKNPINVSGTTIGCGLLVDLSMLEKKAFWWRGDEIWRFFNTRVSYSQTYPQKMWTEEVRTKRPI